jgi:pimeloyl-ACP methyl ester carboxylesterase
MKVILALLFTFSLSAHLLAEEAVDYAANIRAIDTNHVQVNDIDIAYKVLGDRDDPAILMIMGLGSSHILWRDNLPNQLVEAGYQVVLFDNRDVGESQRLDEHGNPTVWWEFIKAKMGFEVNAPYDLSDMATDSIGLMDELQLEQAHIVGASMGGMIAQVLTARYPERVISLTSIMSTPGFADHLPPAGELGGFTESQVDETEAEAKARLESFGFYLDALPRQIMAIIKSGDRSDEVKTISTPTLVIHGNEDTLIPVAHGVYTAELIEGSKFIAFDGMGHNMPAAVLPAIVSNMLSHMKSQDTLVLENVLLN